MKRNVANRRLLFDHRFNIRDKIGALRLAQRVQAVGKIVEIKRGDHLIYDIFTIR
jgi:hypothetical protein